MLPDRRAYEDDPCPVPDQVLGEMYRCNSHGLNELIATVPPNARAMLALYCYRRAHLASVGLAIAASCEEDDLMRAGGNAGAVLFTRSREAPQPPRLGPHMGGHRKITLATAPLREVAAMADETED